MLPRTLLPSKSFPVCISLGTVIVAQALSIHASVKHNTAGTTGQGTGGAYHCCEEYHNPGGCCCVELICPQVSIPTLVDTVLHSVDLLGLLSTFNLFYVGLQG